MSCELCSSTNLAEFSVEMMIHLSARRSVEDPGVLAFPKVLVCLHCGASRFSLPEDLLRVLRNETGASAAA
jgi:hypothetical protein